jgi:hypothetical protein
VVTRQSIARMRISTKGLDCPKSRDAFTPLRKAQWQRYCETAPSTLYAARGRLIPFNSNSPTGSTFTAFSTFVSTLGLMRI